MKKFKGFTLLETILVVVIIGIVSVSLANFRRNIQENKDISREALTVFYKEMNNSIKDFQRNKIWEDTKGGTHEMTYLYITFNINDKRDMDIGEALVLGNIYLYTGSNGNTRGHFDGTPLILDGEYSAFQSLKGSDKYTFYTRNEKNSEVKSMLIDNNGKIYNGYLDRIITSTGIRIDENGNEIPLNETIINLPVKKQIKEQIKPNTENPLQRLTFDFDIERDAILKTKFDNIQDSQSRSVKFLVCGGYGSSKPQPIGIISINTVTQATNLERCENEKYTGIDCKKFADCNY